MTDEDAARRRSPLLGLAAAVVLLMLCVIGASAWLRLAQPRAPCSEWPACRSGAAAAAVRADLAPGVSDVLLGAPGTLHGVRLVHRVAATAALLIVVALVVLLLRQRPRRRAWLQPALGLLALALGLSVLGVVTPGSRAAAVLLGNLLGGLLMLALAVALWVRLAWAASARPVGARLARLAACTFGLWLAMAALGALAGAGLLHAAPPAHLALAAAALPLAVVVGWSARAEAEPAARRMGIALLWLAPLQFVLGAVGAAQAASVVWVLLHNTVAGLGLAMLSGLMALRADLRRQWFLTQRNSPVARRTLT